MRVCLSLMIVVMLSCPSASAVQGFERVDEQGRIAYSSELDGKTVGPARQPSHDASNSTMAPVTLAAANGEHVSPITTAIPATTSNNYFLGVYYFPGWKDNQPGAPARLPWERIKAYPERQPMLGWYPEGDVTIAEQHIRWMHDYGIGFVIYDWYWNGKVTFIEHALQAYLQARNNDLVPFSLLWANHSPTPRTMQEYDDMVDFWITHYFGLPQYLRLAGKPVLFVFSHPHLSKQAAGLGLTTAGMLERANLRAIGRGLPGIFFVGGTHVDQSIVNKNAASSGYSAFSAYNYHGRANRDSESYLELDASYQRIWDWIVANSPLPYFPPMTSGWDKRPWGGSGNPKHDNSFSDPESFESHLRAGKALMDRLPEDKQRIGVICCWNEFGEGSYIEPTKRWRFKYLERVRAVFPPAGPQK